MCDVDMATREKMSQFHCTVMRKVTCKCYQMRSRHNTRETESNLHQADQVVKQLQKTFVGPKRSQRIET